MMAVSVNANEKCEKCKHLVTVAQSITTGPSAEVLKKACGQVITNPFKKTACVEAVDKADKIENLMSAIAKSSGGILKTLKVSGAKVNVDQFYCETTKQCKHKDSPDQAAKKKRKRRLLPRKRKTRPTSNIRHKTR